MLKEDKDELDNYNKMDKSNEQNTAIYKNNYLSTNISFNYYDSNKEVSKT